MEEPQEQQQDIEQEEQQEEVEQEETIEDRVNSLEAHLKELEERLSSSDEEGIEDESEPLKEREKALFDRQIQLELKAESLEDFADFINAEDEETLQKQIAKLKELQGKLKADKSYQPNENNVVNDYNKAKQSKDVRSMIRNKF